MQTDGPQDERWTVPGVYLLPQMDDDGDGHRHGGKSDGGDNSGGGGNPSPTAVPGLTLTLGDDGAELKRPRGDTVWECAWSDLAELSAAGYSELPGGGSALQLLAVERSGRRWRLVVPSDDTAAMAASVRQRARSHHVRSTAPSPAVRRWATIAVAVLAAATFTVLLLSAAHVFTF